MSQWTAESFFPAGLGIGHADREVDRAADLLVEQDLLGEAVDAVVGADAQLTQPARAIVGVERLEQELLVSLRGGVDDRPSWKRRRTPATSRPPYTAG